MADREWPGLTSLPLPGSGKQYQGIRIDSGGKAHLGDTYILRGLLQTLSEK